MCNRLKQVSMGLIFALLTGAFGALASDFSQPQEHSAELVKQPVFLFCPHRESANSWSLYVLVDKNDPTKPLGLGLEELSGKNSKDNTYNGVLDAQKNPGTQRNPVSFLEAKNFGASTLDIKENNMLSIGVTPAKDGLHLEVNARISIDQHFIVGGSEKNLRDLVLAYSYLNKCWVAKSPALQDKDGNNQVGRYALPLTGIVFTASATGVSRIAAVTNLGSAIMLMDR